MRLQFLLLIMLHDRFAIVMVLGDIFIVLKDCIAFLFNVWQLQKIPLLELQLWGGKDFNLIRMLHLMKIMMILKVSVDMTALS